MCFKVHRKRKQGETVSQVRFRREREGGGDEMKDNKIELNADVESKHAKATFFKLCFLQSVLQKE